MAAASAESGSWRHRSAGESSCMQTVIRRRTAGLSADGTTDVLVTALRLQWVDDGNGLRRSQIRFADESWCGCWHNGLWRPAVGSTTRNPGDGQPGLASEGSAQAAACGVAARWRPRVCRRGCCVPRLRIGPRWLRRARSTAAAALSPIRHRPAGIPRVRRNRCRKTTLLAAMLSRVAR